MQIIILIIFKTLIQEEKHEIEILRYLILIAYP